MTAHDDELPTVRSLEELAELVGRAQSHYVRWSKGPAADADRPSKDELTGVPLSGLSANPLSVEEWWGDRPVRTWLARRLYDYRHLQFERGEDTRAWVLEGRERARGPDNEPLVELTRPLAWIADEVVDEAIGEVEAASADGGWGPLQRGTATP